MSTNRTGTNSGRTALLFGMPTLWSALLILIGIVQSDQSWGIPCLIVGGLCALIVIISYVFRSWVGAIWGVMLVTAVCMLLSAFIMFDGEPTIISIGVMCMVVLAVSLPVTLLLKDIASPNSDQFAPKGEISTLREALQQIHEHTMLSDHAKRVLFRERELGLLRQAIEMDIQQGKYNAGLALCDQMAEVFGYREEAEAFRSQILKINHEHREQQIQQVLNVVDNYLNVSDWRAAYQEAARFKRLFPDPDLVQQIDLRIHQAREAHKRDLETQFLDAHQKEDTPRAMELLRELDRFMHREEAGRLADAAAEIVAKHRENLGTQFKMAVNDKRWAEALRIGDEIVAEYPNTKMAEEIREMIDTLRTRASQPSTF